MLWLRRQAGRVSNGKVSLPALELATSSGKADERSRDGARSSWGCQVAPLSALPAAWARISVASVPSSSISAMIFSRRRWLSTDCW